MPNGRWLSLHDEAAAGRQRRQPARCLTCWPATVESYSGDEQVVRVRDEELRTRLTRESLSGNRDPAGGAAPVLRPRASCCASCARRTCRATSRSPPGCSRSSAKARTRRGCSPGEGDPFRTNRRFKLLSEGSPATRLSTAFDSVTLYGRDPGESPDVYGKVGTSGVSIATLEDMKALFDGFDLTAPNTSVSMTINGPAPDHPRVLPQYRDRAGDAARGRCRGRARVLSTVRGTVQADILKEDQGQNTCIFSTEFSLRMMADIQEWFIAQPGAQLLLGVDLRLPHRRGRGQPDQPARVHPGQRVHLRRVLPRAGDEGRRLRAQPVVLLLQRHGPRVHGHRPGRPADLGGGDAGPLRRERAVAEAQVPRPDLGPVAARAGDGVQRHPHHAAGAVRDLRQRQQPAHQRLRRGGHHPVGGVGPPRARHPDDHRQGVGPGRRTRTRCRARSSSTS